MSARTRFLSVDFSAARDAGHAIWIATGEADGDRLVVTALVSAAALPDGGRDAAAAHRALRAALAGAGEAIAGLDFPFGLPRALVPERSWTEFAAAFATRYGDAETFRAAMRRAADERELKRRTDIAARVPFSAYNIRLYRQTWYGIAAVLAPLRTADAIRVVPMEAVVSGKPAVVEASPASTLKAAGLYTPYKGAGRRDARRRILAGLGALGLAPLAPSFARIAVENPGGDALDAVIAALATFRARAGPDLERARDATEAVEGRVYF
ncbi:MAG: hypothetical protein FJX67_17155 [Alphaproteobacteria bacterium]|nr:hypothetical protein [Alphaproteobacteria bacterium]